MLLIRSATVIHLVDIISPSSLYFFQCDVLYVASVFFLCFLAYVVQEPRICSVYH